MKMVKMGLIGTGTWGETHARIYHDHPHASLITVCDLNESRARAFAEKHHIATWYTDYRTMLKEADIDAVAIVTPDFLHTEMIVAAAEAGKSVLVEKPLATKFEDLVTIKKAQQTYGVRIMVDFHNRWSPPFAQVKRSIEQGELGELACSYFRLNDKKFVATDMLSWAAKSSPLWFLGSHVIDTLRWLYDDEVDQVYAVSFGKILKKLHVDCEDVYQAILTFKKGTIATIENGWISPNTNPCINDIKFNITGSNGMYNLDLSNSQMVERITEDIVDRPDVLVSHYVHGKAKGFAFDSIVHFVDCLLNDEPFLVDMNDGINTSLVILSILESVKSGLPVTVHYNL